MTMAVDLQRVVKAAVDALLQQPTAQPDVKKPRRRLSGGRALLIGAGVVTAGRLVAGPKGREMLESLQQRIEESDWYSEDGEPEGEAEEDFEDEEPEGEAEEDFEDEEPEGEAEEDFEEEEDFEDEEPEGQADEEPDDEEVEEERPRSRRTRRVKTRGR